MYKNFKLFVFFVLKEFITKKLRWSQQTIDTRLGELTRVMKEMRAQNNVETSSSASSVQDTDMQTPIKSELTDSQISQNVNKTLEVLCTPELTPNRLNHGLKETNSSQLQVPETPKQSLEQVFLTPKMTPVTQQKTSATPAPISASRLPSMSFSPSPMLRVKRK